MSLGDLPGLAEVAMQSGAYAGRRIRRQLSGRSSRKAFRYIDLGSAAYVARGRAVVSAGPLQMSGLLGWLTWLFIHIAFLTGYRNRFTAVMTWLVAFSRGVRRERAFTTQEIETRQEVFRAG
jgi:NADH dehydrogenase